MKGTRKGIILDHSECIMWVKKRDNARFVVKNSRKNLKLAKQSLPILIKVYYVWQNIEWFILPFNHLFVYLWQNITHYEHYRR